MLEQPSRTGGQNRQGAGGATTFPETDARRVEAIALWVFAIIGVAGSILVYAVNAGR